MRIAFGSLLLSAVLLVCAAPGCPAKVTTDPPAASGPAPGQPLELEITKTAIAGHCATCDSPAGSAHACGKSVWCPGCKADAAGVGSAIGAAHVCNVSHFCAGCGLEAAIAGHRCGESKFEKASLSDVDREDDHEDDDDAEDNDQ